MRKSNFPVQCLVILMTGFTSQIVLGEITHATIQNIAADIVENGDAPIHRPTFDWDGPGLIYNLGGVQFDCPDKWHIPFQEQLRVEMIRRYRNERSQRRFWNPVLRQVESEIGEMVELIQKKNIDKRQLRYNRKLCTG